MTDWAGVYRDNLEAVAALANGLDPDALGQRVPATPAWTVHDVLAHLAGGPTDAINGRMDGAPGPEWTGRHVGERADRDVEDLLSELRGSADAVASSLEGNDRPGLVWNLAVHHADLHEALGKPAPPDHYWRPVLEGIAPGALGENADAFAGVPDYEQFRGFFSRRSRTQMAAWGTGLDQAILDAMCIFGPRDDDQPVPTLN